jgi:hypothetical protein
MRKVTIAIIGLMFGLMLAACEDAGDDAAPPATQPQQDSPPAQQ